MSFRNVSKDKVNLASIFRDIEVLKINAQRELQSTVDDDKKANLTSIHAVLFAVESKLTYLDEQLKEFFIVHSRELIRKRIFQKHQSSIQNDREQEIFIFKNEYQKKCKELITLFGTIVEFVREKSNSTPIKLDGVADQLAEIVKLIPDINKIKDESWVATHLYTAAEALGSTYIAIGQGDLALAGGKIENNVVMPTGGNCGGMVMTWADECVKFGTPKYPIGTQASVLVRQDNQFSIKSNDYNLVLPLEKISDQDFVSCISRLKSNHPHYIVIHKGNSGHAIGIRKHKKNDVIEIYDPNYGYFFFRDAVSAATWFALHLQQYLFSKSFPCEHISIYEHKGVVDQNGHYGVIPIPDSHFPSTAMLDEAVIVPFSKNGYQNLIEQLTKHLEYIVSYVEPKDSFDTLLNSILHLSNNLTDDDKRVLIEELDSCINQSAVVSAKNVISAVVRSKLSELVSANAKNEKQKLETAKAKIASSSAGRKILSPALLGLIEQMRDIHKDIILKINELSDELRQCQTKDKNRANELSIMIDILVKRRKKYDDSNIETKINAGHQGLLANYDQASAEKEFEYIFGIQSSEVKTKDQVNKYLSEVLPADKLSAHKKLLGQLAFLKSTLGQLDYIYSQRDPLINGLYNVKFEKEKQYHINHIYESYDLIAKLQSQLLVNENSHTESVNELIAKIENEVFLGMVKIESLHDMPSTHCGELSQEHELACRVDILWRNQITKFSVVQMGVLNDIYMLIKTYPQGAILSAIDQLVPVGETQQVVAQQVVVSDLKYEVAKIKNLLLDAVDPAKNADLDANTFVKNIINLIKEIAPSALNSDGMLIPGALDLSGCLLLPKLPNMVLTQIKEMKGSLNEDVYRQLVGDISSIERFVTTGVITVFE